MAKHNRGAHPADAKLFSDQHLPVLQQATEHLSWLLSRGYASPSSLKLVGDRFDLAARQRKAVLRSACSDQSRQERAAKSIGIADLKSCSLEIDTLNLLITIEAAISGGVVLLGRDAAYRDMASIHGSYREVTQTQMAIDLVARFLGRSGVSRVLWRIDRPVSNSGRLRALLMDYAAEHGLDWDASLDEDPDRVLGEKYEIVVSADAGVLQRVQRWANLAHWVIEQEVDDAWIICMTTPDDA